MPPQLTEENVREIIREELSNLIRLDRYTFQKHLQLFDGRNFQLGKITGSKIGTETSQKMSVYGVTPVIQQSKINDANAQGVDYVQADAQSIADKVAEIIDALEAFGISASS